MHSFNIIHRDIKPENIMVTKDEKLIRGSFVTLRNTKEELNKKFPELCITELSMGMSADYTYAIEEGSTIVRVGTALFGERVTQ